MTIDVDSWLTKGGELKTSGSTGTPKTISQPIEKIKASNRVAIDAQHITKSSRIYTVCSVKHAGGLLAQSLPAHSIGAEVVVEDFNAYRFVREIHNYTHTHLTPDHARAIMMTKGFKEISLDGLWVTCGSDRVEWNIIREFVKRGAVFMSNWGMTEVGPIAINATYRSLQEVFYAQERAANGTILGNTHYCEHMIDNGCLHVKGDISVYGENTWFKTDDIVTKNLLGELFYIGRKDAS